MRFINFLQGLIIPPHHALGPRLVLRCLLLAELVLFGEDLGEYVLPEALPGLVLTLRLEGSHSL